METRLRYPSGTDLRSLLRFETENGSIWLGDRRMLLVHTSALAALRQDLVRSVGAEQARRLLTRMGYESGVRDAEFARKTRGASSPEQMFNAGPQLHMLEGAARVTPLAMNLDIEAGRFYGEYRWDDSWEAYAHRQAFGVAAEPSCWALLGYASGYTSAFMKRLILYKEVECAACGAAYCRIVGKPIEEWPDGDAHRQYFEHDSLLEKLQSLSQQVEALKSELDPAHRGGTLVGDSPAFRHAQDLMCRAASTQVTVLLTGETGVGKERFARALHELSPRRSEPFVAVNCAALPAELIEAELFGVEKGAYTGAHAARAGRFERAHGGTLFLDEIGDLPLPAQAKLLRVLQDGEIERLGAEGVRKINVRVVAATNVDLDDAVHSGRFRRDLLYRLNVYPIKIPPLRERPTDIGPLAQHILTRFAALHGKVLAGFTERALQALHHHDWPGNIRELENLVERGVILASNGETVQLEHLFPNHPEVTQAGINDNGRLADLAPRARAELCGRIVDCGVPLEQLEAQVLALAVVRSSGNLSGAARLLGMTRPQLAYRLQRQRPTNEVC